MLVIVVKQSLVSASKILPNFEELKKYKPLEILTPEGETDEDNIEQNQKSLGILSEACQDIDPSKIESSPGLKILVKTIDCLKLLEGISKYYDKNYTGPKTFEEYKELFKDLKTTPYRGNLFAIMEEEINDYKLFKEDAEYIINKEIDGDSCSEDSGSDGDLTKQELMDYKVRKWKYRVNHKVDKRSFLKVLKNGNEHKIGCEEYLKKLNRIHDA